MVSLYLRPFALSLALASCALVGCNTLAGIDSATLGDPFVDASLTDAAAEAPAESGGDPNACNRGLPPDPPTSATPGGSISFTVAIKTLGLKTDDPGSAPFGFNLDNTCTCPGPESCVGSKSSPHCDDGEGRDTSLNTSVVPTLLTVPGFDESTLNDGLARGRYGILLEVSDWNGEPDDGQVTIALKLSPGIRDKTLPPVWDGSDIWDVDKASVDIDGQPLIFDRTAYVSGGLLVTQRFDGATLALDVGGSLFTVKFAQVVSTARIIPLGGPAGDGGVDGASGDGSASDAAASDAGGTGKYQLVDGIIAGRWPTYEALQVIGGLPSPITKGKAVCDDPTAMAVVVPSICQNADLPADTSRDRKGAPCTAISFATRFTAVQANEGLIRANSTTGISCGHPVPDCTF